MSAQCGVISKPFWANVKYCKEVKINQSKHSEYQILVIVMVRELFMPIKVKNFGSAADEAKDMPNACLEAVNVLGQRVMQLT